MSDNTPFVLLGVMSNPVKPILRTHWHEWASRFHENGAVRVRYVFGKTMYERNADPGSPIRGSMEEEKDRLLVDGREQLPHVGLVTEKSAYFWRTAAATEPAAKWFCKCDDDTLVHLDRLANVLRAIDAKHPGEETYLGHMKWRGWDVDNRFQACGGTWGEARKTTEDILHGGTMSTAEELLHTRTCVHTDRHEIHAYMQTDMHACAHTGRHTIQYTQVGSSTA